MYWGCNEKKNVAAAQPKKEAAGRGEHVHWHACTAVPVIPEPLQEQLCLLETGRLRQTAESSH